MSGKMAAWIEWNQQPSNYNEINQEWNDNGMNWLMARKLLVDFGKFNSANEFWISLPEMKSEWI